MNITSVNCYSCLGNRTHIVAACPKCDTGCVMATADSSFSGLVEEQCNDCDENIAFYVMVPQMKAWLLAEPVKMNKVVENEEANNSIKR